MLPWSHSSTTRTPAIFHVLSYIYHPVFRSHFLNLRTYASKTEFDSRHLTHRTIPRRFRPFSFEGAQKTRELSSILRVRRASSASSQRRPITLLPLPAPFPLTHQIVLEWLLALFPGIISTCFKAPVEAGTCPRILCGSVRWRL